MMIKINNNDKQNLHSLFPYILKPKAVKLFRLGFHFIHEITNTQYETYQYIYTIDTHNYYILYIIYYIC